MSESLLPRIPILCADVRYRVVGGKAVVVVQEAGEAVVLNEVGTRILELVDGRRSRQEIEDLLRRQYDADPAELGRDLEEYLEELIEAGILERGSESGLRANDG